MFIVNVTYTRPLEEIELALEAHRDYLDMHIKTGLLATAGAKVPRSGGIIILTTSDKKIAEEFVENDSFMKLDLARYELIEFHPNRAHEDFRSFLS